VVSKRFKAEIESKNKEIERLRIRNNQYLDKIIRDSEAEKENQGERVVE
jgi:hypothetical protein